MGKKKKFDLCATIDCDRTHNPYYLKKMLDVIKKENCAIVNTNRFISLNSLKEWSYLRKILTNIRFFLVKIFLGTVLNSLEG